MNFPDKLEFSLLGYNPIPAFLLSGYLPESWASSLYRWQVDFCRKILENEKRISLPQLFLTILSHFLKMISNPSENYNPLGYKKLIFYQEQGDHFCFPLGIVDPLNIIYELCNTLFILWQNKDIINLSEFESFKFKGRGLLQGRRGKNDQWETLIAYCGGQKKGEGKCGYSPLILGKEENCTCGKLICPNSTFAVR